MADSAAPPNHESTHGRCMKNFLKKMRKQTRPAR